MRTRIFSKHLGGLHPGVLVDLPHVDGDDAVLADRCPAEEEPGQEAPARRHRLRCGRLPVGELPKGQVLADNGAHVWSYGVI